MKKTNIFINIVIAGLLLSGIAWLLQNHGFFRWGGYGPRHMGPGMMGFGSMGFMMLFFWGIVLFALVSMISRMFQNSDELPTFSQPEINAIELLKQRYAKGEIDKKEFFEKLEDLRKIP